MNNMQKAFDKKSALRRIHMADGGLVDKAKQDLGNRAATIDAAASGVPTPKPAPAPAPAPKPVQPSEDAQRAAVGMAPKKGFLRSLLGMAEGGHVRGPGGPREDKVPAMLSNGEYVLPAKTVQKLGGAEELDDLVQHTNDGKAPDGAEQRGLRHGGVRHLYGGGGVIDIDSNGRPTTNGVNVLRGNQLATIPGEVAQTPRIPGTSLVPTQPAPTPPVQPMGFDPREAAARNRAAFPTGAGAQSSVGATPTPSAPAAVAEAATPKPGLLSRAGSSVLRGVGSVAGSVLPAAVAQQGFGDYKADTGGVDTSAPGTLRYLAGGEFGNVGRSLSGGAAEALADVGSGVAKVVDGVGGFFGAKPGAKEGYDSFVKDNLGGYLSPRAPNGAASQPGSSLAGAGRGFVNPPSLGVGAGPEGLVNTNTGTPTDAAPSPRSLAQSRYLSENGVDVATQASAPVQGDLRGLKTDPGKFLNLGSFQGPDNIYGTSSKPGGRVNSFVGAGDPNRQESQQTQDAVAKLQNDLAADKVATAQKAEQERLNRAAQGNSGAINARFNDMASKVQGSYSAKGKGNESKRLLEIEAQRNNALEADARNTTSIRGQTLQAQNNSAENVLKGKQIDSQAASHAATLRAQSAPKPVDPIRARELLDKEAQTVRSNEEKGADAVSKAVNTSVERRFPDAKKTGSPDGAKAVDYQNFFNHPGNEALVGKIRTGTPTESAEALTTLDRLYDQRNKVNERGSSSLRGNTSLGPVTAIGPSRDVEFGDYWGQGSLPASQILRRGAAVFNADAGKVQKMSNGQLVPLNDLTNDSDELISNGKNFDKVKSVELQRRVASPRALTDREVEAEARRKQLESIIKR